VKLESMPPAPEHPDPAPFVFGVAWNVARESFHGPRSVALPEGCEPIDASPPLEERLARERQEECLDTCLQRLSTTDRTLVLSYFAKEKRAKIQQRSALAEQLRISPNALRLRVHRMTASLRECIYDCAGAHTAG
jgi:DNA-directed RNA polymerase specialized sigma24 family protein